MSGRQIEFPMAVPVCAWCKPNERGRALGAVSHGICPHHLQEIRLALQKAARAPGTLPRTSGARTSTVTSLPLF